MSDEHRLYWKEQLVGIVTDVGWVDFPEAGGNITVGELSPEDRAVLEYIDTESKTDDGVCDWPFAEEFAEHWRIVKPDGTNVEITPPVLDFAESFVTWR